MSTYVDYKINLLDNNDFTQAAGINTDNVVAVGWFTSSKHLSVNVIARPSGRVFACKARIDPLSAREALG